MRLQTKVIKTGQLEMKYFKVQKVFAKGVFNTSTNCQQIEFNHLGLSKGIQDSVIQIIQYKCTGKLNKS